jgi:predicted nuclease of restriction endonuclease-like (RecB) superfamily
MEGQMSKMNLPIPADFPILLKEIKNRIQQAQTRDMLAVNAELVQLYWDIGRIIAARQQQEGWGAAVIPRLSRELLNELPEVKGFSERNIKRMLAFYREYTNPTDFLPQHSLRLSGPPKVPQAAAQLEKAGKVPQLAAQLPDSILWSIPWFHQIVLMEKVKDRTIRLWYMQQTLTNGCQDRNHIVAEYSLRGVDKPIGISEYALTRALPPNLKSALPTVEEIEAELADSASVHPSKPPVLPEPKKRKASKPSKPTKKKQPKKGPKE